MRCVIRSNRSVAFLSAPVDGYGSEHGFVANEVFQYHDAKLLREQSADGVVLQICDVPENREGFTKTPNMRRARNEDEHPAATILIALGRSAYRKR